MDITLVFFEHERHLDEAAHNSRRWLHEQERAVCLQTSCHPLTRCFVHVLEELGVLSSRNNHIHYMHWLNGGRRVLTGKQSCYPACFLRPTIAVYPRAAFASSSSALLSLCQKLEPHKGSLIHGAFGGGCKVQILVFMNVHAFMITRFCSPDDGTVTIQVSRQVV